MLNEGIIEKVDTIVDPLKVGYNTIAFVHLFINPLKLNDIAEKLTRRN